MISFFTSLLAPQCHVCGEIVLSSDTLCLWCLQQMRRLDMNENTGTANHDLHWLPSDVSAVASYESWTQALIISQKRNPHKEVTHWMAHQLYKHCPPSWRLRPVVWVPRRPFDPPHLVENLTWHLRLQGLNIERKTPLKRRLLTTKAWQRQKSLNRKQRWVITESVY